MTTNFERLQELRETFKTTREEDRALNANLVAFLGACVEEAVWEDALAYVALEVARGRTVRAPGANFDGH